jgi:hypothetical protein
MVMRQGLTTVADLVERIEVGRVTVEDVSLSRGGDGLNVELSVRLPAESSGNGDRATGNDHEPAAPDATSTTEQNPAQAAERPPPSIGVHAVEVGGTLEGTHDAAANTTTPTNDGGTVENTTSSSSDDEHVTCRVEGCDATFDSEHGMKIHATKAHQSDDGSAPSPHRDPERLREVYEQCDTFEEMTEALGVDVTAQTVRRSMMSLGIHDPETAAASEEEVAATNGGVDSESDLDDSVDSVDNSESDLDDSVDSVDNSESDLDGSVDSDGESGAPVDSGDVDVAAVLPPGVDADVFVTALRDASTVYQVQRALGMDREEVQQLLADLGLLELVQGRVATEQERDHTREEIERRILEGTPGLEMDDGQADDDGDETEDGDLEDRPGDLVEAE